MKQWWALAACLAFLCPLGLRAADTRAADLARQFREAGLEAEECYRVRDVSFQREDLRFFFTEGYLIFARPVQGRRLAAVFSAEAEGGDAEVLLMPPTRAERQSLAQFTSSPTLNEHLRSTLMLFTDDSGEELRKQVLAQAVVKKSAETGLLLEQAWNPVLRNLAGSFLVRLVQDVLTGREAAPGFFFASGVGRQLGAFDMLYDRQARTEIVVGRTAFRNERAYFDVWCQFPAKARREGKLPDPEHDLSMNQLRIDATLPENLRLKATTRAAVTVGSRARRVMAFDLFTAMDVTSATVDGQPAEVFRPESLRANLIRNAGSSVFLVVPAQPLETGKPHEVVVQHEGDVVQHAGNRVYYVSARGVWYPHRFDEFSAHEMTFHYPRTLNLVASGEKIEERAEGDHLLARFRSTTPVRLGGFNLGEYRSTTAKQQNLTVEVYANRQLESALSRPKEPTAMPAPSVMGRSPRGASLPSMTGMGSLPLPQPRTTQLADEVAAALAFMTSTFGPPPEPTLRVSPIPGSFGQGFPGLIYLPTVSFLDPSERPVGLREGLPRLMFDLLAPHEVAHQWWGNVVASAQLEDEWLMEALANYSALMYIEKRRGRNVMEQLLREYRDRLLARTEDDKTIESVGPITWGPRLQQSQSPQAWQIITYQKGTWIMHMLRGRLGDERFAAMLRALRTRYEFKAISTDQFKQLAREFVPPKSIDAKLDLFFDQWVYATGIPTFKLDWSVKGKAPALKVVGTVRQEGVDEDFVATVPVEVQTGRGKSVVQWVRTSSEPVAFTVPVAAPPVKVQLDPGGSVLSRR